jgi:hypothetical protein
VRAHLLVEIAVVLAAMYEAAKKTPNAIEQAHGFLALADG